jgi:hypothetical protein
MILRYGLAADTFLQSNAAGTDSTRLPARILDADSNMGLGQLIKIEAYDGVVVLKLIDAEPKII